MLKCYIDELKEGSRLAKAVTGRNGIVILGEGAELTPFYIKRLKEMGITHVYLDGGETRITAVPSKLAAASSSDLKCEDKSSLYRELVRRLNGYSCCMNHVDSAKDRRFKLRYRRALADALTHPVVADWLHKLMQFDEYIFGHAVHVSILSMLLGDECDYTEAQMLELLLGSLLFDVGMTSLPKELVRSDRELSEKERQLLRQHTEIGYRLLSDIQGMPKQAAMVALSHHERFDGSGYPFGRQGAAIPEYARIVALADSYDALVSPRRYRDAYRADDVIEFLFASGDYYFDARLVQLFLQRMKAFPLSSILTLSSGQTGVVTSYRSSLAHRPVVRIIQEAGGQAVGTPYELDLASSSTITVLHAVSQV